MPGFNVFGGVTGRNSATLFEIRFVVLHCRLLPPLIISRLDNEIIVLRGAESEAASQMLKGVVVLCLPSALKVEDVHLRMTGQLKVG
jgi:arrestin-related trafficking adapter 4/5/7